MAGRSWGFTPPEHPSGYHGHYDKQTKPIINKEELEKLATSENLPIFEKYFEATKRLEQTLISSKDFVNHNDDDGKSHCLLFPSFPSSSLAL
jgi:hypothetical protein